jgi:tRNA(Arg) A34 adenosine deaminase TadA
MPHAVNPAAVTISVPDWVHAELRGVPGRLATAEERMDVANRFAARNAAEGTGGPFAAVVCDLPTGRVLAVGVNLVLASGLSSAHAEVVALSLAQTAAGTWALGEGEVARQLVVNARPCAMCMGATIWSGVRSLVIGVEGDDVERLTGFDEGPVTEGWVGELRSRGIEVLRDVRHQESLAVLAAYGEAARRGEAVVYNGRGAGFRER